MKCIYARVYEYTRTHIFENDLINKMHSIDTLYILMQENTQK